jgi:hypothetical protein
VQKILEQAVTGMQLMEDLKQVFKRLILKKNQNRRKVKHNCLNRVNLTLNKVW